MNPCSKTIGMLGALLVSASLAQPVAAQTTLSGNMTVDNVFDAWVTTDLATLGTPIATGDDWMVTYPISNSLTPGVTNYLVVGGQDLGGQEMFVGDFAIDAPGAFRFANGAQALVTNTTDWTVGPTATDQSLTVTSLGTNTDPNATVWGFRAGISESAEFIWDSTAADVNIFVTAIEPTTDVAISAITDTPDPVLAGSGEGNFTAEIDVTNAGVGVASGVQVTVGVTGANDLTAVLPLPAGFDGTVWTVGDLAAGETKTLSVTFTVGVNQTSGDDVINWTATVTAVDQTDLDATNDTLSEATSVTSAADLTSTFATSIVFTNGDTGTVTAALSCNAGLPLEQSADISVGSPVNFTMTDLPFTTPGTTCEITATDVDGYTVTGSANGGAAAASCMFDSTTFDTSGANSCAFTATPNPTAISVETIVATDDPTIGESFVTTISCDSVNPATDDNFGAVTVTDSSGDFMASWYADPDGGTTCTVSTVFADSAIETEPCKFSFDVGDTTAGCDVIGTVFFEGIPTLSQYGLALLALLMLGVGFVGMRRFV